jgi:thymidylate synthase (FAD)
MQKQMRLKDIQPDKQLVIEKGMTFGVLDHGYVKVIDWMGDDADIIRSARMSTGRGFEGWGPGEVCDNCRGRKEEGCTPDCGSNILGQVKYVKIPGDAGLLENLLANRHTTPFEMCELKMEVMAPIMVYREWHRHRTQSYSEFSARYAQMPNLHYIPELERICKQSKSNKQGSAESLDPADAKLIIEKLDREQQDIYGHYNFLVEGGVANEVARINTPVSRYSKMTAKTDLWNWLAFLNLREDPPAQWEIRQYALIVSQIIRGIFPRVHALWEEYMRYAIRLSRTEHTIVRTFLQSLEAADGLLTGLRNTAKSTLGDKKAELFMKKLLNPKE